MGKIAVFQLIVYIESKSNNKQYDFIGFKLNYILIDSS